MGAVVGWIGGDGLGEEFYRSIVLAGVERFEPFGIEVGGLGLQRDQQDAPHILL